MNILICGADGFLGRHLGAHLRAAGHQVVRGVRHPSQPGDIHIDYCSDLQAADWLPRLTGIDVVINAIGILIESRAQPFDLIHAKAPQALFDACAAKGDIKVIQISALGVEHGTSAYFRSKLAADHHLSALDLKWAVVRPSLIYGFDGASSRLFRTLASLPVIALPGGGTQPLQPIHVDDLCRCVQMLVEATAPLRRAYSLAGSEVMSYRDLLATYRHSMGLSAPCFVSIPMSLMALTARIAEWLPQRVLSRDTLSMLAGGNTTNDNDAATLCRRTLIAPRDFIAPDIATAIRSDALHQWTNPLLHAALAVMWLFGGLTSALQKEVSLQLLAETGLRGTPALATLILGCALDLLMAVLTMLRPSRALWLMQFALVCAYTAIISIWIPEMWLHPFGPVVKNLPILAVLIALYASDTRKA